MCLAIPLRLVWLPQGRSVTEMERMIVVCVESALWCICKANVSCSCREAFMNIFGLRVHRELYNFHISCGPFWSCRQPMSTRFGHQLQLHPSIVLLACKMSGIKHSHYALGYLTPFADPHPCETSIICHRQLNLFEIQRQLKSSSASKTSRQPRSNVLKQLGFICWPSLHWLFGWDELYFYMCPLFFMG